MSEDIAVIRPPTLTRTSPPALRGPSRASRPRGERQRPRARRAVTDPTLTRRLCAAAHLDRGFRQRALAEVLEAGHAAVAPSHGVDVVPVLRHCLAAAHREHRRDLGVTAVAVAALAVAAVFPGPAVWVADLLAALTATAALERGHRLHAVRTVRDSLQEKNFTPDAAPPAREARHAERLAYLASAQHGNVTMYARARRAEPFVGAGGVVRSWTIAVPLAAARPAPDPLTVDDVHAGLVAGLESLDGDRDPAGQRLPLSLEHRLFVEGLLPAAHPLLHEGRPMLTVAPGDLAALELAGGRRMLCAHASQDHADVTVAVHARLTGTVLALEFTACVLRAPRPDADTLGPGGGVRMLAAAVAGSAKVLAAAPFRAALPRWRRLVRMLAPRGGPGPALREHGATTSLRELAADDSPAWFPRSDAERCIRVLERRVVEATAEVLDHHGFAGDEFTRRAGGA